MDFNASILKVSQCLNAHLACKIYLNFSISPEEIYFLKARFSKYWFKIFDLLWNLSQNKSMFKALYETFVGCYGIFI